MIQLTPQTEAVRSEDAPVAPRDNTLPDLSDDRGWSFDISSLKVADSVLVFQHEDDEQVTIRNIRLQMEQDPQHRGSFEFSGRVNRDQRDLTISLNGTVDASDYPHDLMAAIEQINWQLQGADLPKQGIQGQGSFQVQWQESHKRLSFNQISLTANDSTLSGQAQVTLTEKPEWQLRLQFPQLNLDNLIPLMKQRMVRTVPRSKGRANQRCRARSFLRVLMNRPIRDCKALRLIFCCRPVTCAGAE